MFLHFLGLGLMASFIFQGCLWGNKKQQVQVTVKLPAKALSSPITGANSAFKMGDLALQSLQPSQQMGDGAPYWGQSPLTDLAAADCYMIYIKDPESAGAQCHWANGEQGSLGQLYGLYSAGSTVTL
ncbi:MAG: hypothetical protein N2578_07740, partial [Bdellovibrionaceae bacterium]|nr:hypothetical protein [Pseudobdellovibrionaceae bacterium]